MTYADTFNIRTKNVKFNDVADAIDGTLTRGYGGTTTGTSTAYISSPTPAWAAYDTSIAITIIPHITNTAGSPSVTLNVSGLGPKALKTGGSDLLAGVLVAGRPTILIYTGVHFEVTVAQNALLTDGSNSMLTDLNFGGFKPSNVAAGTALLPAFCAGGDVNTGVFGPAADTWAVSTNGAERVRVTDTGRVGIGTTSPTSILDIQATDAQTTITRFSADTIGPRVDFQKSRGASVGTNTIVNNGDFVGQINWWGANGSTYNLAAQIRGEIDGSPGASNDMPGRLTFHTTADGAGSATERMRITNTGLVGIGTTSPGELLHLRSSAPRIRFEDTDGGGALASISGNSTNGTLTIQADTGNVAANSAINFDVDGATRVQMNQYGLGVNVTPFINTLSLGIDMEDNVGMFGHNNYFYISANTYYNGQWLRKVAGAASLVAIGQGEHIWYNTGSAGANTAISWTIQMRINTAGDVCVGQFSTSPYWFEVIRQADTSQGIRIRNFSGGGSARSDLLFGNNSFEGASVICQNSSANGSLGGGNSLNIINGIGTNIFVRSGPSGGVVLGGGATSWAGVSDARRKKNVELLEYGLNEILALTPIRFDYLDDESEDSKRLGFIAQDVQTIIPEAIGGSEESFYTLSPTELIPAMVNAIQALTLRLQILEEQQ
jgi:hypothetical protein